MTFSLVGNHPFIDGNKRIGTYVMLVLLELNHIEADFSDAEIVRIGLSLADGSMNDRQLLDIILEHLGDK
jgi:death-on-curing protein